MDLKKSYINIENVLKIIYSINTWICRTGKKETLRLNFKKYVNYICILDIQLCHV